MAKGYFLSIHRSESDPVKRQAYLELAIPALEAFGAKFLATASGEQVTAKENGIQQRVVLIEFESYDIALAAYDSSAYQKALQALDGGSDRDFRIVEGIA